MPNIKSVQVSMGRMNSARISAILVASGACIGADAATFEVNRVDAGGVAGQSIGHPITWSPANTAFNPPAGGNRPPSHYSFMGGSLFLEFDSYCAIDGFVPSFSTSTSTECGDGYTAMGPTHVTNPTSPTTIFQPGQLTGMWFNEVSAINAGFVSSLGVTSICGEPEMGPGTERLLVAPITLRTGTSAPTTSGVAVNIRDFGTVNPLGETGLLKFGPENATDHGGLWGQSYYLQASARSATHATGAFRGGTSYAIYVVALPAPGTAGIAGLAGLAALRRRR